jgi:hypothetical protein
MTWSEDDDYSKPVENTNLTFQINVVLCLFVCNEIKLLFIINVYITREFLWSIFLDFKSELKQSKKKTQNVCDRQHSFQE